MKQATTPSIAHPASHRPAHTEHPGQAGSLMPPFPAPPFAKVPEHV